ncbi:MAG: flagellar hook-basal body complex protein FliE [Terriglobales bacterium]
MIPATLPPSPLLPADTAGPITPPSASDLAGTGPGGGSFASQLQGAVAQMEQLQSNATQQVNALLGGKSEDVHSGMIAVEKSDLAFGFMLQLRNKAVEAYQQIASMNF